jgi:alpha-glucosidase (family GH31 glycosyl hydrolase)
LIFFIGHHPFFIELREEFAHGVFLANNLGMDVVLGTDRITYKVMGGILDFYVFLGPSVEEVVQQYQSIIGKPKPPPFWGVGYHQCRWGYKTLAELEQVYSEFQSHHLPLDTLWSDIDYMDRWKIWTLDQVNYPQNDLKNFVDSLHQANLHYVMIVDPGIKIQPGYWVYDQALRQNLFISNSEGTQPQIGKVWPGAVHFLDFTQVSTMNFWKDVISTFHDSVGFDGLWLDMNELANFCDGHCKLDISNWNQTGESEYQFNCVCSEYEFHSEDFPPFWPGGVPPGFSTLTLSSKHFNSSEFEVHSLYGLLEAKATHLALEQVRKERSFIISRSTFAGSGSWTGHWLGDNSATWQDLQDSISGIINMNLFGIPFVGADICGFNGNTTAELCGRWYQLGALYPFSRNHNGFGYMSQEPYTFGDAITSVVRSSLELRYSLLSFYYSHLFEISLFGGTFIDALAFEFPGDSVARTIETQFLIGKALMFAPVCESGQIEKQVYFPEGALWYNYFTGKALPHENRTGIWKDFSSLHFEEIFLFLRGGSVVFTQAPALNSEETRKNPISIIVGLDPLRNASANFFVDDGISKFDSAYSRYSAWNVFATSGSQGIGQIDVMITQQNYTLEGLEWNNITLYGVAPPCTLVLLNYTEELEFVYDHHTQVLVIVLNRSVYDSFSVYWGEGEPTQSILERIIILVGSLTLTLSLLSCVSVLMYYYGKAHRRPPTFCCKRQRREISFDSLANETLLLDGPKDIPMTEM